MPKRATKTSFTPESRREVKPRGKSKRTIIFDAIKARSLLDLNPESTTEEVEQAFLGHVAMRAFDPSDSASGMLAKELLNRSYPPLKPVTEPVTFTLSKDGTPSERANEVMDAASSGEISPDVARIFLDGLASMMRIEETTDLKRRIEELEEKLGLSDVAG